MTKEEIKSIILDKGEKNEEAREHWIDLPDCIKHFDGRDIVQIVYFDDEDELYGYVVTDANCGEFINYEVAVSDTCKEAIEKFLLTEI